MNVCIWSLLADVVIEFTTKVGQEKSRFRKLINPGSTSKNQQTWPGKKEEFSLDDIKSQC